VYGLLTIASQIPLSIDSSPITSLVENGLGEQGGSAHVPHGASMESVTCYMALDPSILCIT